MKNKISYNGSIYNSNSSYNGLSMINCYILGILIEAKFIGQIVFLLGMVEGGLLPIMFSVSLLVSIFSSFLLSKFKLLRFNKYSLILIILILIYFLISYLILDEFIYLNDYF